jgi:hypothetical protein
MLVLPFRVFGYVAHRHGRYRRTASSRNSLLVQSSEPCEVSALLVLRSHFAVGRSLGCVVFPRKAALGTFSDQCTLSSSFAFLQSLAQHNLARRPQSTGTSHGLSFPTALEGPEVHCRGRCRRPLRSAFRVWLPSGRLTPSEPVPVLFHTGGARGIRPAELSPLGRYPPRFRGGRTHVPFLPPVIPSRAAMGRPSGPRFLGFCPSGSPWRPPQG